MLRQPRHRFIDTEDVITKPVPEALMLLSNGVDAGNKMFIPDKRSHYVTPLLYVTALIVLVLSASFVSVNNHERALDTAGDPLQARADLAARQKR